MRWFFWRWVYALETLIGLEPEALVAREMKTLVAVGALTVGVFVALATKTRLTVLVVVLLIVDMVFIVLSARGRVAYRDGTRHPEIDCLKR